MARHIVQYQFRKVKGGTAITAYGASARGSKYRVATAYAEYAKGDADGKKEAFMQAIERLQAWSTRIGE